MSVKNLTRCQTHSYHGAVSVVWRQSQMECRPATGSASPASMTSKAKAALPPRIYRSLVLRATRWCGILAGKTESGGKKNVPGQKEGFFGARHAKALGLRACLVGTMYDRLRPEPTSIGMPNRLLRNSSPDQECSDLRIQLETTRGFRGGQCRNYMCLTDQRATSATSRDYGSTERIHFRASTCVKDPWRKSTR